jgi:hypothetical protein
LAVALYCPPWPPVGAVFDPIEKRNASGGWNALTHEVQPTMTRPPPPQGNRDEHHI